MINTFSLHKFTNFCDIPFDKTEYSFFKYGSIKSSYNMGTALGKAFADKIINDPQLIKDFTESDILVFPSSYGFIPSAANLLKDYFLAELNLFCQTVLNLGKSVCDTSKIQRYTHYKEDYAALSYEERKRITSNDRFYIDSGFAKHKILIFVDDIKITGRHEELIEQTLAAAGLSDCKRFHLYYAELIGDADPSIESKLNTFIEPSIEALKGLRKDGIVMNTRFIKFVLKTPKNTIDFLHYFDMHHCCELYQKAISEGYYTYPQYRENLNVIKHLVSKS